MGVRFERKHPRQQVDSAPRQSSASAYGTAHSKKQQSDKYVSESASSPTLNTGGIPLDIDLDPLMSGMAVGTSDQALFEVYRDIYWHDPVCGAAVDLFSTLPFSNYSFGGGRDTLLDPYYEVNERLNLAATLPNIATDQMVTGAYCGSMLYNREKKRFVDLMNHRYDNVEITPIPFNSQDPILELRVSEEIRAAFNKTSTRMDKIKENIGKDFVDKLMSGNLVELDPIGTIYIPRRSFTFGQGVSLYRRVLALWLIEKNLYRGTLIESGRRQRGILQAQVGDGSDWIPSPEELEHITNILMAADADPIGSIVTTQLGVQLNEFRQGGDFWKVTDILDQTMPYKLRAMGVSESFLSGEATLGNTEANLSVFIEYLRCYRDRLTRDLFYNKIFPLISLMEGFVVSRSGKIVRKSGLMDGGVDEVLFRMNDGSKLFIPSVHWEKQLRPEQDQGMLDTLRAMTEMGLPVSMRAIAAAGGYNLNQLLMDQDENLALQRRLLDYKKKQIDLEAQYAPAADASGGGGDFSSLSSSILQGKRRPNLLNRFANVDNEIYDYTATGKPKLIINQKAAQEKADRTIVKAIANLDKNAKASLYGTTPKHESAGDAASLRRFSFT